MIFGVLESFNDSPLLLYLAVISIACIGGGIPPMLERRRRRSIENQLPTFLEALSDSVGAGRGLQEAMMEQSESNDGLLASLLAETLKEAHASSFEASLQAFAAKTRSSQVQRVMMLIETAMQQDSSLRDILTDLSRDYERLNDLMNRRETELSGRGMLIIIFVSVGLPVLIAFIVGLFAPCQQGVPNHSVQSDVQLVLRRRLCGRRRCLRPHDGPPQRHAVVAAHVDGDFDGPLSRGRQSSWRLNHV